MVIAALEEALLGNIDVLFQLVMRYTVIKWEFLSGCKYSPQGVDDARAKIEHNIPGLINSSNRNLVTDLCHKLQLTL